MPGPLPMSPEQRRRNRPGRETVLLPWRSTEPAPPWPLSTHPDSSRAAAEFEVWREQWTRPQAVMWRRQGTERVVGRYVRTLLEAEALDATAALRREARALEDTLGISPSALARLRWQIADSSSDDTPTVDGDTDGRDSEAEARRRAAFGRPVAVD